MYVEATFHSAALIEAKRQGAAGSASSSGRRPPPPQPAPFWIHGHSVELELGPQSPAAKQGPPLKYPAF